MTEMTAQGKRTLESLRVAQKALKKIAELHGVKDEGSPASVVAIVQAGVDETERLRKQIREQIKEDNR